MPWRTAPLIRKRLGRNVADWPPASNEGFAEDALPSASLDHPVQFSPGGVN